MTGRGASGAPPGPFRDGDAADSGHQYEEAAYDNRQQHQGEEEIHQDDRWAGWPATGFRCQSIHCQQCAIMSMKYPSPFIPPFHPMNDTMPDV